MTTTSADSTGVRDAAPSCKSPVTGVVKGLAKLLTTGALIYITYISTIYFAHSGQSTAPVPEGTGVRAKKEIIAAENAKPKRLLALPTSSVPVPEPAPKPGQFASIPVVTTAKAESASARPAASKSETIASRPRAVPPLVEGKATSLAPAPPLAPSATPSLPGSVHGGLPQEPLYKAVCQACHDADGKGGMVRKVMPEIPDFTDPKWQKGRTDADLIHSVTEGKGRLMLPMKDRLSQAQVAPEAMVAFVRAFNPSPVATAPATGSPPRPETR